MEPLRNLALGDLSPARRHHADHTLSRHRRDPPVLEDRTSQRDRPNRAFGGRHSDNPGYPGRGPVYDGDGHRTADDRAVEAMLASIGEPCTAQQLAGGLGWTLPRTVHALERLEESLANTGQTLNRVGHHNYTLGGRPGLLHDREIARCLRHNREPLDLTAAAVLHRAITCPREDRAGEVLTDPRTTQRRNT